MPLDKSTGQTPDPREPFKLNCLIPIMKKCSHCKQEKELNEFFRTGDYCKKCSWEATKKYRVKSDRWLNYVKRTWTQPNMIFARKKANAKKEGIKFTIKKREFIKWYKSQKLECIYCNIKPENFKQTEDTHLLTQIILGIDRTDNKKGYDIDNITLSCRRCNNIKNNFFSYEEMKFIGSKFVKPKWIAKGVPLDNLMLL